MIKRSSSAGKSKQSEEPVKIVDVKLTKLRKTSAKKKDVIASKPIEPIVKVENLKMEERTESLKVESKKVEDEPMEKTEPHKTMFDFEQYL